MTSPNILKWSGSQNSYFQTRTREFDTGDMITIGLQWLCSHFVVSSRNAQVGYSVGFNVQVSLVTGWVGQVVVVYSVGGVTTVLVRRRGVYKHLLLAEPDLRNQLRAGLH